MILQTVETNTFTQKKITYQPVENYQICLNQIQNQRIQPSQKPINQLQNKKRFLDYKDNIDNQFNQTKSEMSRSTLARMNRNLEERTNFYAQYGKYDSKWTEENMEKFGNKSRLSVREQSPRMSVRSSGYSQSRNPANHLHHSRTKPIIHNAPIFIPQQHQIHYTNTPHSTYSTQPTNFQPPIVPISHQMNSSQVVNTHFDPVQPVLSFQHKNPSHISQQYRNPQIYQHEQPTIPNYNQYNIRRASDIDSSKDYHPVRQAVRDNIRGNVKNAVGQQNYQLISQAKQSVGQLKQNVKENIKENVKQALGPVYVTAKDAKDQIVDVTSAVKQGVKVTAKQGVQKAIGKQNFNLLRYIKYHMGALRSNLFGRKNKSSKKQDPVMAPPLNNRFNNNVYNQNMYTHAENQAAKQLSPIEYSQRNFSQVSPSIADLASVWIFALVLIGIFLVIFQIMK